MFDFKLRTKIMTGAVALVILMMVLSTLTASLIIYRQNRDAASKLLEKTMQLVEEDLKGLEETLMNNGRQIANKTDIISNLNFVNSMSLQEAIESGMKMNYQKLATVLFDSGQAAELTKAAAYRVDGLLVSQVVYYPERTVLGFPLLKGFEIAELKTGEALQFDSWKEAEAFPGFETKYPGTLPTEPSLKRAVIDEKLSLICQLPVIGLRYNEKTDEREQAQIGSLILVYAIPQGFADRLSRMTGTEVNLFGGQALSVGTLSDYRQISTEGFQNSAAAETSVNRSAVAEVFSLQDRDYFHLRSPLLSDGAYVGAVAALYRTDIAMANTWQLIRILILVAVLFFLGVLPLSFLFSNTISKPLVQFANVLESIETTGEFTQRIAVKSRDEIGQTALAFNKLMTALQSAIDKVNEVMEGVGQGNLSNWVDGVFKGDLATLQQRINRSLELLGHTVIQVISVSGQVNSGTTELNRGATSLAEGTSVQAANLEEIASSMAEIRAQSKSNNERASEAKRLAGQALTFVETGNRKMAQMSQSMNGISETSQQVTKVIKVIEEIAFQTNLLALNAAVEAARAGKYGKGFAVVAEEVRNLAARSSEAAKETNRLVENSVREVEQGVQNAAETASSLSEITQVTGKVNDLVEEIAVASREQEISIEEINKGLEQVNEIVQRNSAISEETSSASQELSNQATDLQNLMYRFQVRDSPVTAIEMQED